MQHNACKELIYPIKEILPTIPKPGPMTSLPRPFQLLTVLTISTQLNHSQMLCTNANHPGNRSTLAPAQKCTCYWEVSRLVASIETWAAMWVYNLWSIKCFIMILRVKINYQSIATSNQGKVTSNMLIYEHSRRIPKSLEFNGHRGNKPTSK